MPAGAAAAPAPAEPPCGTCRPTAAERLGAAAAAPAGRGGRAGRARGCPRAVGGPRRGSPGPQVPQQLRPPRHVRYPARARCAAGPRLRTGRSGVGTTDKMAGREGAASDRHLGGCSSGTAYGPEGWAGPGSAAAAAPAGPACPRLRRETRAGPTLPCGLSPLSLSQRSLESSEQERTRCQQSPDHTPQSQRGRGSNSAQGAETGVTSP